MHNLEEMIKVARGEEKAELLLKNAQLVNVFSGEIHPANVAVHKGIIVGFDDYEADKVIDLNGKYLCPGFIDGHVHIESSMLSIMEFAKAVIPLGTTSAVIDPHEIANVLGLKGIKLMIEAGKHSPLSVFVMLPSCVPATDMEVSGANLSADDLSSLIDDDCVLGLGEMMNFPGVIFRIPEVLEKLKIAKGKRLDGHAPGLLGKDLNAYISTGISSDHECTQLEEALEKLRKGMHIMIREGSTAKNLKQLLPLITSENSRRCFFVTDDRHPSDLMDSGHINLLVKMAIEEGLDPVTAVQMATINTAEYFGLKGLGAIAPGYKADLLVINDLKKFNIEKVYKNGQLAAKDNKILEDVSKTYHIHYQNSMKVDWSKIKDLKVKAESKSAKIIEIIPNQIVTKKTVEEIKIENGLAVSDIDRDILKIVVMERHKGTGNVGIGFVKGFGLKRGAVGSSVAHDSHNIIIIGVNDDDMVMVAKEIICMGGGLVVAADGKVIDSLALPIAGLMSDKSIKELRDELNRLHSAAKEIGCKLSDPFMTLSFLALPVIPELKLTDKGLVDVTQFKIVPLFEPKN